MRTLWKVLAIMACVVTALVGLTLLGFYTGIAPPVAAAVALLVAIATVYGVKTISHFLGTIIGFTPSRIAVARGAPSVISSGTNTTGDPGRVLDISRSGRARTPVLPARFEGGLAA